MANLNKLSNQENLYKSLFKVCFYSHIISAINNNFVTKFKNKYKDYL